jgi:aminoglycoside N3'-acetyltransferase
VPTFSRNEVTGQLRALGVTADLFWRQTGVVRSDHLQAFAAVGPHAEATVKTLLPLPCHVRDSPVGLVHDLNGHVLQRGVGHEADTSLHLAELIAKGAVRHPAALHGDAAAKARAGRLCRERSLQPSLCPGRRLAAGIRETVPKRG